MKKHFFGATAWVFENPARPLLLALIALLLLVGLTKRAQVRAALGEAQNIACPAPVAPVVMPETNMPPAPMPVPSPQWSSPKRRTDMLDARDGCFKLAGLNHNLAKCWSHELWPGPHGVSRWLYYADMAMVCTTKRREGLPCGR